MEFRRWEINLAIEKFAYNQHKQHLQLQSKTQVMVNIISSGEKGQEKMRRDFLPSWNTEISKIGPSAIALG